MEEETKNFLSALAAVEGIGKATLQRLKQRKLQLDYSWTELWKSPSLWPDWGLQPTQVTALHVFQKQFTPKSYREFLAEQKITVLLESEPDYPSLLRQTPDYPELLFMKGSAHILSFPSIAIVGTRRVTPYGIQVTQHFARELLWQGFALVSGCMYGVDVIAQEEAVHLQKPSIGVLGFGFGKWYPRHLTAWFEQFLAAGNTLITEYAPGTKPRAGTFPQRNRIVAGLGIATLVTQAVPGSGSLITAEYAKEYKRVLATVPGPFNTLFSQGTQILLEKGAHLVSSGENLIGLLRKKSGLDFPNASRVDSAFPSEQKKDPLAAQTDAQLYQLLTEQPLSAEELANRADLPISQVVIRLTMLELQGAVRQWNYKWMHT
jgi:DNA processing protein